MPYFSSEIEIDVDEFWDECSSREKEELIDILEEDGWVRRTGPKGSDPSEGLPSIPEIEWGEMMDKLSTLRQRLTLEEEELIKNIVNRY